MAANGDMPNAIANPACRTLTPCNRIMNGASHVNRAAATMLLSTPPSIMCSAVAFV